MALIFGTSSWFGHRRCLGAIQLAALAAFLLVCITGVTRADDDTNLLLNGDLTKGSGDIPENWSIGGWKSGPPFAHHWHHKEGEPGELEVSNTEPDDSEWYQKLHLGPGWYHFTASVRAENVPQGTGGANISVLEDGIVSLNLYGTTDWQEVGFYLKVSGNGSDIAVGCRLGGFSSLNTGKAFCRNIKVVPVTAPPADADTRFQYDLDATRGIHHPEAQPASAAPNAPSAPNVPAPTVPSSESGGGVSWVTVVIFIAWLSVAGLFGGRKLAGRLLRRLAALLRDFRQSGAKPAPPSPVPPVEPAKSPIAPDRPATVAVSLEPEAPRTDGSEPPSVRAWLLAAAAVVWVSIMAIHRLEGSAYAVHIKEGLAALMGPEWIILTTGATALKVWSFWAISSAVVTGLLLQAAPELELSDAILGGVTGVWLIAYVLAQTLGPIYLFRPIVIWILLIAGAYRVWSNPPKVRFGPLTPGQKMAILAVVLLVFGWFPLEFSQPLAPIMDVLSYAASVQRMLSFGVYLPFDNDPYGCWGPRAQTPGLEVFLAMLGMGGHVKLGVLAQSGMMIPLAVLIIFATWRLGKTLAGDTAGGVAALLLFLTITFRRAAGVRGTSVDFALIALALAFFLDRRRSRTLTVLGALMLGAAIPVHAIIGGLAMMVAGAGVLMWLIEGDTDRFSTGVVCLAGAVLFAVPEFAIGLGRPVFYPVLPLSQFAGIALIMFGSSALNEPASRVSDVTPRLAKGLVFFLAVLIIYLHATNRESGTSYDLFQEGFIGQFPILFTLAMLGMVLWAVWDGIPSIAFGAAIAAIAMLVGAAGALLGLLYTLSGNEAFQSAVMDVGYKLNEYWCPYFLVFPAAIPFALVYDAKPRMRVAVMLTLLVMLIYPWFPRGDVSYDYDEHAISEEWGIGYDTAENGFWDGMRVPRWAMEDHDWKLVDYLRGEQAKGRITTGTHILHIAKDTAVGGDFCRFSVYTGINDDPIVPQVESWAAGSRVRPLSDLRQALAQHPPYILEQVSPPDWMKTPPDGYEEVFNQGPLRLFRRKPAGTSSTIKD
ncbi:MAG TPA: hypothetical protein VMU16_08915 [Candidatus Binataceae bacterium]|nr:hypothetical protein [Candidatus Binataceae bacterium]